MNLYAILGISFIPAVLVFVLSKILNPAFKIKYGILSFVLGLVTIFPASLIQFFLLKLEIFSGTTFASVMITAILFNGLIEETCKLLLLCALPQKKQTLGAFFCCVMIYGLAAGGFESVVYVVRKFQEITLASGREILVSLLIKRIFSAQAIHAFCAGLSGLYLWNFRHFKSKNILPFVFAVLLHGIYNFFISFSSGFKWLALVSIIFAAVECRNYYVSAKNSVDKL